MTCNDRCATFETGNAEAVRIVCVDDNRFVLDALVALFSEHSSLKIVGLLPQADDLPKVATEQKADIVLLDLDMPGRDPFEALADLARRRPETRTIIVSGHLRADLVDRALAAGAWGYVCKNAGPDAILSAIQLVRDGQFVFGPDHLPEWP